MRIASLVALGILCACSASPPSSVDPSLPPGQVRVIDGGFSPATLTIDAGDTVTWMWAGRLEHTVTADDRAFDSGNKRRGASFSQRFAAPGTFSYYCMLHSTPGGTAQNGLVTVRP